jgi:hypothetical protein
MRQHSPFPFFTWGAGCFGGLINISSSIVWPQPVWKGKAVKK